jgi:23S rRNA (adenine2503-C2)-methyltransferase
MSPRRITGSSIGITPGLVRFLRENEAHLAISLHTPFHQERQQLMPVQIAYPPEEVIDEIKPWDFSGQRRVSFEYIMFHGLNDTPLHVKELCRLLEGIRCRINLIRFHPVPGTPLKGTDEETLQWFKDQLNNKGILTTIRASRGQDIYTACGLLSTKELATKKA